MLYRIINKVYLLSHAHPGRSTAPWRGIPHRAEPELTFFHPRSASSNFFSTSISNSCPRPFYDMARSHGFRHKRNAGDSTGANVTPLGAAPERPAKRIKLLDDSASEASDAESPDQTDENSESDGGVSLKINEEYARRFEHNKKREERHRLEEKHGKSSVAKGDEDGASGSDDSSSEDESEDDEGLLATEDLDAEISATLQAIRSKDPRVYDKSTTFYKEEDNDTTEPVNGEKKEKPMYLRDYHRKNLLEGNIDAEDENDGPPQTYAQEQEALRDSLVKQMHAAAGQTAKPQFQTMMTASSARRSP